MVEDDPNAPIQNNTNNHQNPESNGDKTNGTIGDQLNPESVIKKYKLLF